MRHHKSLTPLAQQLRKNMTPAEKRLWYEYLRHYPVQFRRQVAFGNFIMDFYSATAKLAIEVDGAQHYEDAGLERDAERTAFLEGHGIRVLRFTNAEVLDQLSAVCQYIDAEVKRRTI